MEVSVIVPESTAKADVKVPLLYSLCSAPTRDLSGSISEQVVEGLHSFQIWRALRSYTLERLWWRGRSLHLVVPKAFEATKRPKF